jgi:transcriptional regulator with XRE-family HTH domain
LIAQDVGKDASFRAMVEEEKLNAQVAQLIYDARVAAKLTQKELADLAGTTQPVIARLEDSDYEGHSLTMLRRIAEALDHKVVVQFLPRRSVKRA